jgi:hypothetical protein
MTVKTKLNKTDVKNWLRGQNITSRFIERERVRFLLQLTADKSATIYRSLQNSRVTAREPQQPSPVLWAMRKLLKRYAAVRSRQRA